MNTEYYTTSVNIDSFNGLEYYNNSCYIDSVLISLFTPNNNGNVLREILLHSIENDNRSNICCSDLNLSKQSRKLIQKELSYLFLSINKKGDYNIKNISNLRKLFKNCKHIEDYSNNRMKDPAEFISYIFDLFNVCAIKKQLVYGIINPKEVKLIDKSIDNNASVVITHILNSPISLEKLVEQNETNKITFNRGDDNFIGTLTMINLIKAPFIVFHIQRNTIYNSFNLNKVTSPDIINIGKTNYKLSAVIVFNSNHYTAFFRKSSNWYYYDDMSPNVMIKSDDFQIESKGVLYFYY